MPTTARDGAPAPPGPRLRSRPGTMPLASGAMMTAAVAADQDGYRPARPGTTDTAGRTSPVPLAAACGAHRRRTTGTPGARGTVGAGQAQGARRMPNTPVSWTGRFSQTADDLRNRLGLRGSAAGRGRDAGRPRRGEQDGFGRGADGGNGAGTGRRRRTTGSRGRAGPAPRRSGEQGGRRAGSAAWGSRSAVPVARAGCGHAGEAGGWQRARERAW